MTEVRAFRIEVDCYTTTTVFVGYTTLVVECFGFNAFVVVGVADVVLMCSASFGRRVNFVCCCFNAFGVVVGDRCFNAFAVVWSAR